jgi:signal transduction histidine kinase/uncharacterized protein YeeX (DUF496 family)
MKTLAVFITWLLLAMQLQAQTPALDSLRSLLVKTPLEQDTSRTRLFIEMSNRWSRINPDSALFFANAAYKLSAKQNFKAGLAESLSTKAWVNIHMGNFAEGYEHYINALNHFSEIKDESGIASVYNGLGVTYGMQENYTVALQYFFRALKIFERNKMTAGMASCYLKIGTLNQKIHDYDKALENFKKSIQLSELINDKVNQAHGYNNIGTIYGIRHEYEKCIEATTKSKELAEESKSISALASSYMNMGMAYSELKNYSIADTNLNKALYYFKQLKSKEQIARTYNGLANLYFGENQISKAKRFIDSSNAIARELNNKSILYDNLETMVGISRLEGRLDTAAIYYEAMLSLKDSLFNSEKNNQIEKLKGSYDLEKKQATIEDLKKDNISKTKQRNSLILAIVIGSLLTLLLIFSFIDIKRKNRLLSQQKAELKELNNLKDKFYSILSHDLRSPICNILLVIDFLSSDIATSAEERVDLLKKLKSATSSTLETMDNLLQWGKFQTNNIAVVSKKINLQEAVERVVRFLNQSANNKSIAIVNKVEEPFIVNADENQFEFILRNLVSNSLKFSYPGSKVEIWARKLDGHVCLYVRDYGTGMSKELQENLFKANERSSTNGTAGEIGSGLGLVLSKEFITQNNGQLTVKSEVGAGTTFAIKLPDREN